MSERKTGATNAQIEAAVQIHMTEVGWRQPYHSIAEDQVRRIAERLVRPDERIIALDDLKRLRGDARTAVMIDGDKPDRCAFIKTIDALIAGDDAP